MALLFSTDSFAIGITNLDKVPRQISVSYIGNQSRTVSIEPNKTYRTYGPVMWLNIPGGKRVMVRTGEEFVVDKDGIYVQRRTSRSLW